MSRNVASRFASLLRRFAAKVAENKSHRAPPTSLFASNLSRGNQIPEMARALSSVNYDDYRDFKFPASESTYKLSPQEKEEILLNMIDRFAEVNGYFGFEETLHDPVPPLKEQLAASARLAMQNLAHAFQMNLSNRVIQLITSGYISQIFAIMDREGSGFFTRGLKDRFAYNYSALLLAAETVHYLKDGRDVSEIPLTEMTKIILLASTAEYLIGGALDAKSLKNELNVAALNHYFRFEGRLDELKQMNKDGIKTFVPFSPEKAEKFYAANKKIVDGIIDEISKTDKTIKDKPIDDVLNYAKVQRRLFIQGRINLSLSPKVVDEIFAACPNAVPRQSTFAKAILASAGPHILRNTAVPLMFAFAGGVNKDDFVAYVGAVAFLRGITIFPHIHGVEAANIVMDGKTGVLSAMKKAFAVLYKDPASISVSGSIRALTGVISAAFIFNKIIEQKTDDAIISVMDKVRSATSAVLVELGLPALSLEEKLQIDKRTINLIKECIELTERKFAFDEMNVFSGSDGGVDLSDYELEDLLKGFGDKGEDVENPLVSDFDLGFVAVDSRSGQRIFAESAKENHRKSNDAKNPFITSSDLGFVAVRNDVRKDEDAVNSDDDRPAVRNSVARKDDANQGFEGNPFFSVDGDFYNKVPDSSAAISDSKNLSGLKDSKGRDV